MGKKAPLHNSVSGLTPFRRLAEALRIGDIAVPFMAVLPSSATRHEASKRTIDAPGFDERWHEPLSMDLFSRPYAVVTKGGKDVGYLGFEELYPTSGDDRPASGKGLDSVVTVCRPFPKKGWINADTTLFEFFSKHSVSEGKFLFVRGARGAVGSMSVRELGHPLVQAVLLALLMDLELHSLMYLRQDSERSVKLLAAGRLQKALELFALRSGSKAVAKPIDVLECTMFCDRLDLLRKDGLSISRREISLAESARNRLAHPKQLYAPIFPNSEDYTYFVNGCYKAMTYCRERTVRVVRPMDPIL